MTSPAEVASQQVIALVPVRGRPLFRESLGKKPLLVHTLDAVKESHSVQRILVTTEDQEIADLARQEGAEVPFLRPLELAEPGVPLERVFQHAITWLESNEGYKVDVAVLLEVSHPFRPPGLIDRIVNSLVEQKLDSVFVAVEETASFWFQGNQGLTPIGEDGHAPRSERKPIYREISGMVCATRGEVIKRGDRLGRLVGMVPIRGMTGRVDVRSPMDLEIAKTLLPTWEAALEREAGEEPSHGA